MFPSAWRVESDVVGVHTLNSDPMTERITIANMDMTMLFTPLAPYPNNTRRNSPYHDHAFIADTTGFTMMGAFRSRAARGAEGSWVDALRAQAVGVRLWDRCALRGR
jgi:phage gp46-like protein